MIIVGSFSPRDPEPLWGHQQHHSTSQACVSPAPVFLCGPPRCLSMASGNISQAKMLEFGVSFHWPGPVWPFSHGCLVRFSPSKVLLVLTVLSIPWRRQAWIGFCSLVNRGKGSLEPCAVNGGLAVSFCRGFPTGSIRHSHRHLSLSPRCQGQASAYNHVLVQLFTSQQGLIHTEVSVACSSSFLSSPSKNMEFYKEHMQRWLMSLATGSSTWMGVCMCTTTWRLLLRSRG